MPAGFIHLSELLFSDFMPDGCQEMAKVLQVNICGRGTERIVKPGLVLIVIYLLFDLYLSYAEYKKHLVQTHL